MDKTKLCLYDEAFTIQEMEEAMQRQAEYEADFESFQNGDMSWDDFSQKYPDKVVIEDAEN